MIIDLLVDIVLTLVEALLALVPDFEVGNAPSEAAGHKIAGYATQIDSVFPVTTLLQVIAIGLLFAVALTVFRVSMFVYHQFWGSS